jgi:uncharacterized membrane protein YvlD (DUF360 family)
VTTLLHGTLLALRSLRLDFGNTRKLVHVTSAPIHMEIVLTVCVVVHNGSTVATAATVTQRTVRMQSILSDWLCAIVVAIVGSRRWWRC